MEKRKLGPLEVSELGLGCMGMSFAYGPADEGESIRTIHRALELGVNFLDTAELYGPYKNEELVGRAVRGKREQFVIATKFAFRFCPNFERTLDSSPAHIFKVVEESLRRLGTDYIDLYYQHRLDPATPIEDTVGALATLVKQGKVRAIGLCEVNAKTIRRAHAVHPIAALQTEYSLWETEIETKALPTLRELGIGLVPYSPVGRGFLTGQIQKFEDLPKDDFRRTSPRFQGENFAANLQLVTEVQKIAARKGVTPSQVALGWLLQKGQDIVPIPGTTKVKHLEENVGATTLKFTGDDWKEIDAILARFAVSGARYADAAMKTIEQ